MGLAGLPRPPNFGPRCLGVDFIVKGGMGNSWRCSALPAAAAPGAREPHGPGASRARVCREAARLHTPGRSGWRGRRRIPGLPGERALCRLEIF